MPAKLLVNVFWAVTMPAAAKQDVYHFSKSNILNALARFVQFNKTVFQSDNLQRSFIRKIVHLDAHVTTTIAIYLRRRRFWHLIPPTLQNHQFLFNQMVGFRQHYVIANIFKLWFEAVWLKISSSKSMTIQKSFGPARHRWMVKYFYLVVMTQTTTK